MPSLCDVQIYVHPLEQYVIGAVLSTILGMNQRGANSYSFFRIWHVVIMGKRSKIGVTSEDLGLLHSLSSLSTSWPSAVRIASSYCSSLYNKNAIVGVSFSKTFRDFRLLAQASIFIVFSFLTFLFQRI